MTEEQIAAKLIELSAHSERCRVNNFDAKQQEVLLKVFRRLKVTGALPRDFALQGIDYSLLKNSEMREGLFCRSVREIRGSLYIDYRAENPEFYLSSSAIERLEQTAENAFNKFRKNENKTAAAEFFNAYNALGQVASPSAMNLAGIMYRNPNLEQFDLVKSHELLLRSYDAGFSAAAYNLAYAWQQGLYGRKELERAKHWFGEAFALGHGCAGASYARYLLADLRSKNSNDEENREYVRNVLRKSEELGGPWAYYANATSAAIGFFGSRQHDVANERYVLLASDEDMCGPPKARSAINYALRSYLGFGGAGDYATALDFIDYIPHDEHQGDIKRGVIYDAARLNYIINNGIIAEGSKTWPGDNRPSLAPHEQESHDIVQFLYDILPDADAAYRAFKCTADLLTRGEMVPTESLGNRLWAAYQLAENEGDPALKYWHYLRLRYEESCLGVSTDQLMGMTRDLGPRYNEHTEMGWPIPWKFKLSDIPTNVGAGLGKFTRLIGDQGNLHFQGEAPQSTKEQFIFQEDINVITVLVFGDHNESRWPGLSIEPLVKPSADSFRWRIHQKQWRQEWLAHTMLGKTFYATDYWIGKLAGTPEGFRTDAISDPKIRSRTEFILNELSLCGGADEGPNGRVMLVPEKVNLSISKDNMERSVCSIWNVKMRVDGAGWTVEPNGMEDRTRHLNDSRFQYGHVGNMLTDYYDEIANMFPMYERLRQLNAVLYAAHALRDSGFRLSAEMQTRVNRKYENFRSLPRLSMTERLCL